MPANQFEEPHGIGIMIPRDCDDLQSMMSISFHASSGAFPDSCVVCNRGELPHVRGSSRAIQLAK